jgi:hypothetical protein
MIIVLVRENLIQRGSKNKLKLRNAFAWAAPHHRRQALSARRDHGCSQVANKVDRGGCTSSVHKDALRAIAQQVAVAAVEGVGRGIASKHAHGF